MQDKFKNFIFFLTKNKSLNAHTLKITWSMFVVTWFVIKQNNS